jgi:hypothetical protein
MLDRNRICRSQISCCLSLRLESMEVELPVRRVLVLVLVSPSNQLPTSTEWSH